jgi:hypothetical protein
MQQSHLPGHEQEAAAFVRCRGTGEAEGRPGRHAQICFPGLPAEFPPLDLDRLLAAKILRLLIRNDFLRIDVGVDRF